MSYSVHIRGPTGKGPKERKSGPKLNQMFFEGENKECCTSVVGEKEKRQIGSDNWMRLHALISTGKCTNL